MPLVPLANRFLDPTDCFLIAFDIVSFSQNLKNPIGLERDRIQLFQAIDQSPLVKRISHAMVGQFLGDEYRLAIPSNHDGTSINTSDVVEFIDEVFRALEVPALGYAPVIRAALTKGPVRSRELQHFCYLSSGTSLPRLSRLLKAIDGKDNLLITNLSLPDFEQIADPIQGGLYTKSYRQREVPKPFYGLPSHDLPSYVVVSVTNEPRDVNETLLDFALVCLEGHRPERVSVSPSSILFAFREARFEESKRFLRRIQDQSRVYRDSMQIAVAIGYGPGRSIDEKEWLPKTFESGAAIEACRLLAKLPMGALAIPDDPEQLEFFSPLSNSLSEKRTLPGKRKESFQCRIHNAYFLKEEPTATETPNVDTTTKPDRSESTRYNAKTEIRNEPSENQKARNMLLSDQDWAIVDDLFSRIPPFDEYSRQAFLLRIATTKAQSNAFEKLSAVLGNSDFFVHVKKFVRASEDVNIEHRTLSSLLEYVINTKDGETLQSLIWRVFEVESERPSTPETKPSADSQCRHPQSILMNPKQFREQCQKKFVANKWPELINLLDERMTMFGPTARAKDLSDVVVIFRSDYASIRKQARDGLVGTEEERRLLVSLWSRVLMLIDDINDELVL